MTNWIKKIKTCFADRKFIVSFIYAFLFLTISLFINYYAGTYATERASSPVTDIILSNIRVFDVDGIFIYGSIIFVIFITIVCFYNPKKIPFTLKSIAFFTITRAIFISLTHIGPFPTQIDMDPSRIMSIMNKFTFGGDLFF